MCIHFFWLAMTMPPHLPTCHTLWFRSQMMILLMWEEPFSRYSSTFPCYVLPSSATLPCFVLSSSAASSISLLRYFIYNSATILVTVINALNCSNNHACAKANVKNVSHSSFCIFYEMFEGLGQFDRISLILLWFVMAMNTCFLYIFMHIVIWLVNHRILFVAKSADKKESANARWQKICQHLLNFDGLKDDHKLCFVDPHVFVKFNQK